MKKTAYENRLWKYRHHNFEVYWDALDRSRIEIEFDLEEENVPKLQGLARLLYSEARLENIYNVDKRIHATTRRKFQWIMKYNLKKFDDSGDPNMVAEKSSGYAEHKLPYGRRLTADEYVNHEPLLIRSNKAIVFAPPLSNTRHRHICSAQSRK